MQEKARQQIEGLYCMLDDPEGLSKADWDEWRPHIASACAATNDDELRKKGREVIDFFNEYHKSQMLLGYSFPPRPDPFS